MNGGTVVRPHVAKAILRGESVQTLKFKPVRKVKLTDVWAIKQGLYEAAHSAGGTSTSVFGSFPVPVAGKTGTAESGPGRSDHSWYASWAPANEPEDRRRRPDRARRVRRTGRGAGGEGDLPVVLQAEEASPSYIRLAASFAQLSSNV